MNYLREINAFYDWLETNSIPDSAIVLWHALMHTCNKTGWVTEFAVAISVLEAKTGLKKAAVVRARQRLQQAGRIDFKSRAGQQSAVYRIIGFAFQNETQSGTQIDCVPKRDAKWTANRSQSGPQTDRKVDLLLNKTNLPNRAVVADARETNVNYSENHSEDRQSEEKTIVMLYEEYFGRMINPFLADKLAAYQSQDGMAINLIEQAFRRSRESGKDLQYAEGILRNWRSKGIRTIEQAKEEQERWMQKGEVGNAKHSASVIRVTRSREEQSDDDEYGNIREYKSPFV